VAEPEQFTVTFEPLPDHVPAATRIRNLLKTALRRDRLKAVSITDSPVPKAERAREQRR
jgi:hypothetical protein